MLSFFIIFGASLAGYAGVGPWALGAGAIGLASLSYSERYGLIRRANELGLGDAVEGTLAGSLVNAVAASTGAYAGGAVLSMF